MSTDRSTPALSSLYQALILDHYKRPRNRGTPDSPNREAHVRNPSCGDDIRLTLQVANERIEDARFSGEGCAISQAAASMMTELIKGATAADVQRLTERFKALMHGDKDAARDRSLGDLRALAGVSKFPVRVKCALLPWDALAAALAHDPSDG